jgi:hypothetical protein
MARSFSISNQSVLLFIIPTIVIARFMRAIQFPFPKENGLPGQAGQ